MATLVSTHAFTGDIALPASSRPVMLEFDITKGDAESHLFSIYVRNNGSDVILSGATCMLYVVRDFDGATVALSADIDGSTMSKALSAECAAYARPITILATITSGGITRAVWAGRTNVREGASDVYVDPGSAVPSIGELLAAVADVEAATLAAEEAAAAITGITAEVETLEAGEPATAEVEIDPVDGHINLLFGIPEGDVGDTGASIVSAAFVSNDLVFTKDDATTVTLEDAKVDLKGDKGDTGDTGDSGVHTGSEEPTDPAKLVWIDPDGEASPASEIGLLDTGEYFTDDNVEDALQEVGMSMRNENYVYCGRDLSTVFADEAAFITALRAGAPYDIRIGDYWPLTLNGTYWDYGTYTCPSGTTYYSDTGLSASVDTTAQAYEATYVNETYCSISIGSTTYYVSTAACTTHYERTLSNAIFKQEVGAIDNYLNYGDSALTSHHITFVSRDLIPHLLRMRKENSTWTDGTATVPWLGSALYKTLNDPDHGILALVAATALGAYIHVGPNSKGMRYLAETKAAGVSTATGWGWADRGKLFLPSEREVWGSHIWDEEQLGAGLAMQWPIFRDSLRHVIKGLGNGGSRGGWWCLSSYGGSSAHFADVGDGGRPDRASAASASLGAPLCFLVS